MAQKVLWFRAKRYGWGWVPNSWQGWLALVVYVLVLVLLAFIFLPHPKGGSLPTSQLVIFLLFALSATMFLLGVCFSRGEQPRWQWGDRKKEK